MEGELNRMHADMSASLPILAKNEKLLRGQFINSFLFGLNKNDFFNLKIIDLITFWVKGTERIMLSDS